MKLIQIYKCLCDPTRLRIINLLGGGELCVCHIQEVLGESQVKVSKHLAYLRSHRLVEVRREANWMVYRLPEHPAAELTANLACLQDCAQEDPIFRRDNARIRRLKEGFEESSPICCEPAPRRRKVPHHPNS
jgi:ArsR family transcriptional regulator, arsenate/arsenite/antimonite-responsive transcriptional repressor